MKLVQKEEDIINNLRTLENYLASDSSDDSKGALGLIGRGRCFVVYRAGGIMRFAPSRFIGYVNNNLKSHASNMEKNGNVTNQAIRKLFGKEFRSKDFDRKYESYCKDLGRSNPQLKSKMYWTVDIKVVDFPENMLMLGDFPEGKYIERIHIGRERNQKVIKLKKSEFLKTNGQLFCEVCGFNFEKRYGVRGSDFCEVHHTIPVSQMELGHQTSLDELAIVCSNCHRMIHRERPWLSMSDLKKILV